MQRNMEAGRTLEDPDGGNCKRQNEAREQL